MAINKQNLKVPTSEEAREIGRKGGIASGKARKEKKLMKETLEILLSMNLKDGEPTDIETIQSLFALQGKNISVQEAIVIAQIQKATKGDTKAAEFLRDTAGQSPALKLNADLDMNLQVSIDYGDED